MNWLKTILANESVTAAAKTLGKAILYAVLSTVGVSWATGCTSAMPKSRGQSTEIVAVGIPAVAWISHSTQVDESEGGDTNSTEQTKIEK